MIIKKGSSRIVLLIASYAVKLPIIRPIKAIKVIWKAVLCGRLMACLTAPYDSESLLTFQRLLLRGLFDNLMEYYFYLTNNSQFLAPTYFSFFGLLNIQKAGSSIKTDHLNFKRQMRYLTNWDCENDGHTFANTNNFCIINCKLVIVDYGSIKTQQVLKNYGNIIAENFDFDYQHNK